MDYGKYEQPKQPEVVEGNNRYANLKNHKGRKVKHRKAISFEDKVKVNELVNLGVPAKDIAKSQGITKQTVFNLVASLRQQTALTNGQKHFLDQWEKRKLDMADDMALLSKFIYESINIGDIDKCSLPQKVTSMAILQDKALLMRGEATSRVAFDGLSDDDLMKVIKGDSIEAEIVTQNP